MCKGLESMSFDQNKYVNQYKRDNYDRLSINIPKGGKAILQKEADVRGISVTALIVDALESCYKIDLSKKD